MKTHLFYTFLVIFAATAVVTLLGVTGVILIKDGYLTALVTAFLVELAGTVIAIFKGANFFAADNTHIAAEEELVKSIQKLDAAFGYLNRRMNSESLHFQCRLFVSRHLAPTPETDMMVLVSQIEAQLKEIHPDVIKEAIGGIADVLETNVRIGSSVKSALHSLCRTLPPEFAGESSRLLQLLK